MTHIPDLRPPASGADQQLDDLAVVIVAARLPDPGKRVARPPPVAAARLYVLAADGRIAAAQALPHRPDEEGDQRPAGACCRRVAESFDGDDAGGDIAQRDLIDRHAMQR